VDFIGGIDLAVAHLGHGFAERLEVVHKGLINKNIAVGQKKGSLWPCWLSTGAK
jgi:hypothetical protein